MEFNWRGAITDVMISDPAVISTIALSGIGNPGSLNKRCRAVSLTASAFVWSGKSRIAALAI